MSADVLAQVWKFPLTESDAAIEMPVGSAVLSVQMQHGVITVWALVDPLQKKERRSFYIVGTGWSFNPTGLKFCGSVQDGPMVWHIFEKVQP